MASVVVQGPEPTQVLEIPLSEGQVVRLGRAPVIQEHESVIPRVIPWDRMISRTHIDLVLQNGELHVQRLPTGRNLPRVDNVEQAHPFQIRPQECFRIGETSFEFQAPELHLHATEDFADDEDVPDPSIAEVVYSLEEIRATEFGNETDRLEVFSKLPELLAKSKTDAEFAHNLVKLLLPTIPLGQAAAVIRCQDTKQKPLEFDLLRSVLRDDSTKFRPSRRLVKSALEEGTSRVHQWNEIMGVAPGTPLELVDEVTNSAKFHWAICVPVPDQARREWCLYVTGRFFQNGHIIQDLHDLKPDVRYIELLAQFVGAARRVRMLQRQQGLLGHFFSPNVVEWLNQSHDPHVLLPRPCDITALVCDLRGFSRKAEGAPTAKLRQLLSSVSDALGVMTRSIFHHDGVVGDYQGDSALGFWGWPRDHKDGPILPACRAALMIQNEFRRAQSKSDSPLAKFRIGIGIANGTALAGKIGTEQHAKVGAFGPVIERGSQLESLTKTLRASILLDEATAKVIQSQKSTRDGRCRRLGRVRFSSAHTAIPIYELLPPIEHDASLTMEHLEEFEAAITALEEGRWQETVRHLDRLPPEDRVKDFLMIFIALNDYDPPPDWDGVITLPAL